MHHSVVNQPLEVGERELLDSLCGIGSAAPVSTLGAEGRNFATDDKLRLDIVANTTELSFSTSYIPSLLIISASHFLKRNDY